MILFKCVKLITLFILPLSVWAGELVCPSGFVADMYGSHCVRQTCPAGFIIDSSHLTGCVPLPVNAACRMNCNPVVNQPAPDGRNCPPCLACPKNSVQVCDYIGNKCKCRDK